MKFAGVRKAMRRVLLALMPWYSEREAQRRQRKSDEIILRAVKVRSNLGSYTRVR